MINENDCGRYACVCDPGFAGIDCSKPACGMHCTGKGTVCEKGIVVELEPQALEQFRHPSCCNHHGICVGGECRCDALWEGLSCEIPKCPNDCGANGHCFITPRSQDLPFGAAKCACFEGWDGPSCDTPVCKNSCNGNGVCLNGTCGCFKGYEGEACEARTYNLHCECSDKCADYCASQCKSAFDTDTRAVGKQCFVGCSKKCFAGCVDGGYEVPKGVGQCETPYCKMLKRTMLDMEGVFSSAKSLVSDEMLSTTAANKLIQEEPASLLPAKLSDAEISDMAKLVDMTPQQVKQLMTGHETTTVSAKTLADSVLFHLSDEERQQLENINKL